MIPYEAQIKTRSSRYIDELVRLTCGPDLLALGLFPNSKEITESFGVYNAVRKHLRHVFPLGDPNTTVLCIGDGSTPRTGATFAFRTAWQAVSIDPNIKPRDKYYRVDRLSVIKSKVEDTTIEISTDKLLIVLVHSHARFPSSMRHYIELPSCKAIVALPCCINHDLEGHPPDIEYRDDGIWSPKNTIKIWKEPFTI